MEGNRAPLPAGFLDWASEIDAHGSKLPHWQQDDVIQFVTFRLGDSLPQSLLRRWEDERKVWLDFHPKPWRPEVEAEYHRRFSARIEHWLDQGMGSCLLNSSPHRATVEKVLMKFEGERVRHHAWVLMPNHVHLLFAPMAPLPDLLKAWKGVSAREIGEGQIWQSNYRDTLVRSLRHFCNAVRYIRNNPRWARLRADQYTLWESDLARDVADAAE